MNKSIGPNLKYIKQIEQQQEVINFLKEKYKESTGFEIQLPQTYAESKVVKSHSATTNHQNRSLLIPTAKSLIIGKITEEQEEVEKVKEHGGTFYDALKQLNLPQKVSQQKLTTYRKGPATNFDPKNKHHMIEIIDLSNFRGRNFTKLAFKDFLESIQDMTALHTLYIKHNGIDDTFAEELSHVITHTKITSLDISQNEIGPKGITPFIEAIKQKPRMKYLKYISIFYESVTRNWFSHDLKIITELVHALVLQKDLLHVAVDAFRPPQPKDKTEVIYKGGDVLCKFVTQHPTLQNLNIIDSHITNDGVKLLNQVLVDPKKHLIELCLKFCFFSVDQINSLALGLVNNKTVVHLDLSHNAISSVGGFYIAQMIQKGNNHLHSINLEHNDLCSHFAEFLIPALKKNKVLALLKIGHNAIGNDAAKKLLEIVGKENTALENMGDLERNQISVGVVEQFRQRLMQNKANLVGKNKDKEANISDEPVNYRILQPIDFTKSLSKHQANFRLWNI